MASKPRTFRKPKNALEEKKMLENAVPKSTRSVNKWAMKIFTEWQSTRVTKKPETPKIQGLETNIIEMTAESLNFWLTKFIMEVCCIFYFFIVYVIYFFFYFFMILNFIRGKLGWL